MEDKFLWLGMVHMLLKELNTTDTAIYEKNYISCLNWMSYFYQKNKVEESKTKGSL
jgi:hypothetical protein